MLFLTSLPKISVAIKVYPRRECLGPLVSLAEGGVAPEGGVGAGCWAQGAGRRAGPPLLSITKRDRGSPVWLPHPAAHPLPGAASPWVLLAVTKGFYCLSLSVSPLQVPPRAARIATAASTELEPLGLQGKLQSQRVYPTLVSIPLLPDSSISPWDNNAKSFTFPKC